MRIQHDSDPRSALARGLADALSLAGIHPGERFEVAFKPKIGRGMVGRAFDSIDAAVTWLIQNNVGLLNCYVGLSAIRHDAALPRGRAGDKDVAVARCLLVDVDPESAEPEHRRAAVEVTAEICAFLAERLGVQVPEIDSGRGRQIWVQHEPLPPGDPRLALRSRLLHWLGLRFNRAGAAVDKVTSNISRLARLPETINTKTNERSRVLDRGDGQVVTLDALEALVDELEGNLASAGAAAVPAPAGRGAAGADAQGAAALKTSALNPDALDKIKKEFKGVSRDPAAWRYLGALASRHAVVEAVRPLVLEGFRDAFEEGVEVSAGGKRIGSRPLEEPHVKRIERALKALRRKPPPTKPRGAAGVPGLKLVELVRRTAGPGRGACFDLTLATPAGVARLVNLRGGALKNYGIVTALALEEGIVLPALKRDQAASVWRQFLVDAVDHARVEATAPDEDLDDLLAGAMRRVLKEWDLGDSGKDLDGGLALVYDGRLLVKGHKLITLLHDALPDDTFTRKDVARVARGLGLAQSGNMTDTRRQLPDGSRPRVWSFPADLSGPQS